MCKINGLMFWGGEYSKEMDMSNQRRNLVQLLGSRNYTPVGSSRGLVSDSDRNPTFEFRVKSGSPLTSRCFECPCILLFVVIL